jgi:uncharacterized protein YeaO (DUF488 family)
MTVKTKRIYDDPEPEDGYRVLTMRYWPRGIKKEKVDVWVKELGTPADLIEEWKADEVEWDEFAERYRAYARDHRDAIEDLAERARNGTVTLLCGCKDAQHCHRSILKELVEQAAVG